MIQTTHNLSKNRLLAALPSGEYKRLLPDLESIYLPHKQVIYEPYDPIKYVYFPTDAVMSLINLMENGAGVEVATVGNEGMVDISVFLAGDRSVNQAVAQIPGNAVRMKAEVFNHKVHHTSTSLGETKNCCGCRGANPTVACRLCQCIFHSWCVERT